MNKLFIQNFLCIFFVLSSCTENTNVRKNVASELENKIQQMVVLCEGNEVHHMDWASQIGIDNIDINYELENFKAEKKRVVDNFERHYIENMLEQTNGNLSEAAKRAGMDRKNFWQKARKHNVRSKESSTRI